MGRAFEFRKERKFKRWDKMAKQFTKIGKEIAIAVKESGPDPANNPRLRTAIQNAKGVNMPKDRVEAAIKRASSKDADSFDEVVYEGYGPNGVAILVECATDNATRTVANIRMYFNRNGGELGKTGSLSFIFQRKGYFVLEDNTQDLEELELNLIDFGLEEIKKENDLIKIFTDFTDFGTMQKGLEELNIPTAKAELVRIPNSTVPMEGEAREDMLELIDKFEQDEDVQNVFHNLALTEEELQEQDQQDE